MKEPALEGRKTVRVSSTKYCDFCLRKAMYDGKTRFGPWAYMCQMCFQDNGVGLGTGQGQRLIVTTDEPGRDNGADTQS